MIVATGHGGGRGLSWWGWGGEGGLARNARPFGYYLFENRVCFVLAIFDFPVLRVCASGKSRPYFTPYLTPYF